MTSPAARVLVSVAHVICAGHDPSTGDVERARDVFDVLGNSQQFKACIDAQPEKPLDLVLAAIADTPAAQVRRLLP